MVDGGKQSVYNYITWYDIAFAGYHLEWYRFCDKSAKKKKAVLLLLNSRKFGSNNTCPYKMHFFGWNSEFFHTLDKAWLSSVTCDANNKGYFLPEKN